MSSNGEAAGPASGQSGAAGSGYVPAGVVEVALEHVVAESPWGRFRLVFADLDDPAGPADADCGPASEAELLRRLAAAEGLVTQLLGRQSADLLALRELRLGTQRDYAPNGHDVQACTRGCCDPDGWIGLEVAHTLAVSERQAAARLETAEHLARFPHLRAAVERGLVQAWTAAKLGEHLAELAGLVDAQRLAQIEADTVAWLTDRPRSVGAVNARMRRVILRARAEAGLDCPRRDARDRRVWVEPAHTGGWPPRRPVPTTSAPATSAAPTCSPPWSPARPPPTATTTTSTCSCADWVTCRSSSPSPFPPTLSPAARPPPKYPATAPSQPPRPATSPARPPGVARWSTTPPLDTSSA